MWSRDEISSSWAYYKESHKTWSVKCDQEMRYQVDELIIKNLTRHGASSVIQRWDHQVDELMLKNLTRHGASSVIQRWDHQVDELILKTLTRCQICINDMRSSQSHDFFVLILKNKISKCWIHANIFNVTFPVLFATQKTVRSGTGALICL